MNGPIGEARKTAGVEITPGHAYGFLTDTTLCIGCKACEVACKQWNHLPAEDFSFKGRSYDHTGDLGATTWRHVLFVEQFDETRFADGADTGEAWAREGARWLFLSDVCKHCVDAPCQEACPTGAIVRTEFDSVYVQQDVCNGCGYCVAACPFGVVAVDKDGDGKAHKCTLCYDRLKDGLEPACAKSCPTDAIRFGRVDELLDMARARVAALRQRGIPAWLYGTDGFLEDHADTGALGGLNAFFLLIDEPEVYNLPAAPRRPSENTGKGLLAAAIAGLALAGATFLAFRRGR